MLKIKNNVDLKKLVDYGFIYDDTDGQYKYKGFRVNVWNRKVLYPSKFTNVELLFDLISDGLVEKYVDC